VADTSNIANAMIALLGADATLLGYCPNGVYYDEAPPESTQFVIVSMIEAVDEPQFQGTAFEDGTYLVKAVMLSTANGDIKSAAARINALLDQQPLTATGYSVSIMRRVKPLRETEVDEEDETIRWQHRGGWYQVVASA
jgi:hypothetical protein